MSELEQIIRVLAGIRTHMNEYKYCIDGIREALRSVGIDKADGKLCHAVLDIANTVVYLEYAIDNLNEIKNGSKGE